MGMVPTRSERGIAFGHALDEDPSSGVTDVPGPTIPGQNNLSVEPVLQLDDGSFAGITYTGTSQRTTHMVVFSAGGNVLERP